MLKKILFVILIGVTVIGCSAESSSRNVDTGIVYPEGIVSENPPIGGTVDDDTGPEEDTAEEGMAESYPNCSNEIEMWVEPNPLTHPCNFKLMDQNGDYVELYDFEGDVILLDFSTVWCSVCKRVAEHVQVLHDQYDPFSAITILTEDNNGEPPSVAILEEWADEYGITTAPVLAGEESMAGVGPEEWNIVAVPTFFLIDKDFYLRVLQPGWNEETITGYIENLAEE